MSLSSSDSAFSTIPIKTDEEKFEAAVLLEYKGTSHIWFILFCSMYAIFAFCVEISGTGVFVRFLGAKYQKDRDLYDFVFAAFCFFTMPTLADLYGRRKMVIALSTSLCLIYIPFTIFTYLEIEIAIKVFFKMQFYIVPVLHLLCLVNVLEFCEKYGKLVITAWVISSAFATESSQLHLNWSWTYRRCIKLFILTVPVFIGWYIPDSPLWLLNKNKSREVLQIIEELSDKKPNIAVPKFGDDVKHSQFRVWKESMRYLFTKQWMTCLIFISLSCVTALSRTEVSEQTIHSTIPIKIPLSIFSVLLTILVFMCMRLRISLYFLNGVLCFTEMLNFAILLINSKATNESLAITWLQYVVVWAAEILTCIFLAESFPTFVRLTIFGIICILQRLVTLALQRMGSELKDIVLVKVYWAGAKIPLYVVMGLLPLVYLRETRTIRFLPNQKLVIV